MVFEAIQKRRSIRRFKTSEITEREIDRLLEAARLAPSGSNVQPWRFIIVRDKQLKSLLQEACYNQEFVEQASVVFVCCGDLHSWKKTREHSEEVLRRGDIHLSKETEAALNKRIEKATTAEMHQRVPTTLLDVAIAIEHIVLEAVELGLGACWIRLFDETRVRSLLNLPEHLHIVALLPVGMPDEDPAPRPRLPTSSIVLSIDRKQWNNR